MPEQPSSTLKFKDGYIVATDCDIEMICHDKQFRDTIFLDDSRAIIFALDCPTLFTSWSMRRTLVNAAGLPVLQIRHSVSLSLESWTIEDAHGKPLCSAKGSKSPTGGATMIDAKMLAENGTESVITLRSADHAGTTTTFEADDVAVAEMSVVQNNDLSFLDRRGLDRSSWKLKVVAGADLALVAALAICRAEVLHAWRR